jgi:hypothetical protein
LAAALACDGHRLIADDILPLDCAAEPVRALATGVSPRLRLPLATSLGARFRRAADRFAGPDDGYYKYLLLPPEAACAFGDSFDPAAFVFLQRDGGLAAPRLHAVAKADAMRLLLLRNFGNAAPPATILDRIERLTEDRPAFALRYDTLEPAVTLIEKSFAAPASMQDLWNGLTPADIDPGRPESGESALPAGAGEDDPVVCRREGVALKEARGSVYLADGVRGGIFLLNPVGAAIWHLLAEPASSRDIAAAIGDAYPDVEPARIEADVSTMIGTLLANRLVLRVEERGT